MNTIRDGNPPSHLPPRYTKELHLQHVQAFWDGDLEWLNPFSDEWAQSINPPNPTENPSRFRIKKPQQLRPWKPDEFPLGARLRLKDSQDQFLALACIGGDIAWTDGALHRSGPNHLLSSFEHSTDNGKTWLPCGVLE